MGSVSASRCMLKRIRRVPLFNGTLTDLIAASNRVNYLSGLQSLIVANLVMWLVRLRL